MTIATTCVGVAQECYDRPMILKPIIEKSIVERPMIIRPIMERAIIEAPQYVRPVRERTVIERPVLDKPEFDWCGDAFMSADGDEGSSLDRSLKNLLQSGRFTPGTRFKRSYLHAIRGEKAPLVPITESENGDTSCCGDDRVKIAGKAQSKPVVNALVYRDRPPMRFPVARSGSSMRGAGVDRSSVGSVAKAPALARASTAASATMVVPRGSR